LTKAIVAKDMEKATEAKSAVEDAQRELRRKREESGEKHVPRFFEQKDGHWVPKIAWVLLAISLSLSFVMGLCSSVPEDPEGAVKTVQEWMWPQQLSSSPPS
jgi:oxysterol-binding protein-related protein 8